MKVVPIDIVRATDLFTVYSRKMDLFDIKKRKHSVIDKSTVSMFTSLEY